MKKSLKVSIVTPNIPAPWPSISIINPELIKILKQLLGTALEVDILQRSLSVADDLWLFPTGTVQVPILKWLARSFPNPLNRPPAIFFFTGEGAKLGYHILHFGKYFRSDDQWVVSSQAEKRLLDYWFPDNNRTIVLHHPVSKEFKPVKDKAEYLLLRKNLNISQNKKIMIYAGRISQQKNITFLLDLLEQDKKLNLMVCGDVDMVGVPHIDNANRAHVSSELITEIGQRGLSSRIEFRPFQSQLELSKLMRASDYQVSLSSHYGEDFGYSIAQGLSCGLRSVLSHWGGHLNWRHLALKGQVTYIDLDWSKGVEVGVPQAGLLLALPKSKPTDFITTYNNEIRIQLMAIINNALSQRNSFSVSARLELINFWEKSSRESSSAMFDSVENDLFKKVIKAYQGQEHF
jgi:glycosyltransferase involved in cell wall biosynthesis